MIEEIGYIREQLDALSRLQDQIKENAGVKMEVNDRLIEETKEILEKL